MGGFPMRAKEATIKDFLGGLDKMFLIPPFQRNYVWDKKNCQELWDDFERCSQNDTAHYLGNIIYYPSENSGAQFTELILVDGQQRLTTILLLLVAIRDQTQDQQLKEDIDNKYLKNATKNQRYRIKLKSVVSDNDDFQKIVDGDTKNLKNSLLFTNYNYFLQQLSKNNIDHQRLFETIAKSEIVDVNLQANNNLELIQTVFEKINSTGQPLTPADLIRNYLLSSNSPSKQKELYLNYWVKIEKNLEIDNIPDFVSDYLLIKTTNQSIAIKDVYDKFKVYCSSSNLSNEQILSDLLDYSEYYVFLISGKEDKCPNKKIATNIKEINILKAADILPALLLLLYKMYDNDQPELEKIISLFSDFVLRYRLVRDYTGGGALQGAIKQIINKLNDETVECKYDDILFELSNSSTKDGEFPTDERFYEILKTKVFDTNEAKVLLSRIEYHNNKDIKIPYEKLTLEHIMPQTFTPLWRKYLGLNEHEALNFHSEYLWTLGNLTLLSGQWNSSLSNRLYDEKKKSYIQNQFKITRNIVSTYDRWSKENIIHRTDALAKTAVKATISPTQRVRLYKKDLKKKTASGQYFISDDFKTEKTKIKALYYKGNIIECNAWYDLLGKICVIAYNENPEKFENIVERNIIAKNSTNQPLLKELGLENDPIISKRQDVLNKPKPIEGTIYYHESNISSLYSKIHSLRLINEMGLDELDFVIDIV